MYKSGNILYENSLTTPDSIKEFILEGKCNINFKNKRLRMENNSIEEYSQKENSTFWLNKLFPDNIEISWDFYPCSQSGLCMMFFSALGTNNQGIFDQSLARRVGDYEQYHHGDINTYHISYYRRWFEEEKAFHTCNLRKSYGFHMVSQGADPIPYAEHSRPPYLMKIIKFNNFIEFYINNLKILSFNDDGATYGKVLKEGFIGFRQTAETIGEYSNLKVTEICDYLK